jgi:3-hydroxyacyl-CoA dehydrogenase
MIDIRKVAVIGAGVMGRGIAAHVANAGLPVLLLDVVPPGATNRNMLAENALAALRKAQPAAFMHPKNARLVTAGNIEDHLGGLADVDWIIEVIVEDLAAKRALYARLSEHRRPDAIVSSNTSTIPLRQLVDGLPPAFAQNFLITHFFNPPRYMRLLEVVAGERTRPEVLAAITDFADRRLGKGVVPCKDRPGFIANRIGGFWLQCAMAEAFAGDLEVEEADAALGPPVGIPKTGVFGLLDLVGLDLVAHVARSLVANLPPDDSFQAIRDMPPLVARMIESGHIGRKGKGGFYRRVEQAGASAIEAIDLRSGDYRPRRRPPKEGGQKLGLRAFLEQDERANRYARRVLSETLRYAADVVFDIADHLLAVDEAMRLGYNWRQGPFEMIDALGTGWFADRLRAEGRAVPALLEKAGGRPLYRVTDGRLQGLSAVGDYVDQPRLSAGLRLADLRRLGKPVASNGSASLWDLGDGIACLEFHTKMNTFDAGTLAMIGQSIAIVGQRFKGLVIGGDGENFSLGVNLGLALFAANVAYWSGVEELVKQGQAIFQRLKYAPFPVVGAPAGMALGGGCEILLHCDAVQAHAESYIGLVEMGVGLVPSWGGCKELLLRWLLNPQRPGGPMPAISKTFETIGKARVSTSAAEARDLLFLRPTDGTTMNRDRVLADAKAKALELARDYKPPTPPTASLPGPSGRVALLLALSDLAKKGLASPHDVVIAEKLATILTGASTDMTESVEEDALLTLERNAALDLLRQPATLARMEYMLDAGKPLRN